MSCGSLRWISGLMAFVLVVQSVLFVSPQLALANGGEPAAAAYDANLDYQERDRNPCEVPLLKRSVPTVLGYVVPVLPLIKTLKDNDRRNFVLIRNPGYGLINTPISVTLATVLAWSVGHAAGSTAPFPSLLSSATAWNFLEAWGGYNVSNLFRDAVTLDKTIPESDSYKLNIWYSFIAYVMLTAGRELARAHTSAQYTHAISLVAFALMWPFFSRWAGMKITKYLFEGFPKDSELNIFNAPASARTKSRDQIIEAKRDSVKTTIKEIGRFESLLASARTSMSSASASLSKKNIRYFQKKLTSLRDQKRSTEKVISRLEALRKGVSEQDAIPRGNQIKMFLNSLGFSTAGAVFMTVIYFMSRWALVGQNSSAHSPFHSVVGFIRESLLGSATSGGRVSSVDIPAVTPVGDSVARQDIDALSELTQQVSQEMVSGNEPHLTPQTESHLREMSEDYNHFVEGTLNPNSGEGV